MRSLFFRTFVLSWLAMALVGVGFSLYVASGYPTARMERRMSLRQIERPEDYLRYARENPPETEALFRDLLIGVTNFFRDPRPSRRSKSA